MKQRFSSLDVKVIAHELSNSLCTLRLANVYDLSSRIFLLKFAKPNHRQQLVVESGFRCHLTNFSRATAAAPSAFVTRLRKFLRTRRVTSVAQVGTDRIIDLQFSEGQYRLFLEFYAGGNIVLTDKELKILALLRIVGEGEEQEELRVGLKYSLETRQNYGGVPALTKEGVRDGLQKSLDKATAESAVPGKKAKKKSGDALRKALATSVTEFPPMLIEHALRVKGVETTTLVEDVIKDESLLEQVIAVLEETRRVISVITAAESTKGYIIAKPGKSREEHHKGDLSPMTGHDVSGSGNLMYEDFHPFRPQQFEGNEFQILEFDGFNKTVDEFFSSIESQKLESRLTEREEHAKRKLEAARQDHLKRIGGLQEVQELNVRKAQAIEGNLQRVDEAIAAVNGLIAQGMDWMEIARLIEMEQARHNPVAEIIKLPLKLYENTVTLLLAEAEYDDEDDFEGDETGSDASDSEDEKQISSKISKPSKPVDKRLVIDVDLALSPWSNAREYYDQKRTAQEKEQRTLQSSAQALKSREKKINTDLKKGLGQEKQLLRPLRKQFWFEKFYYFISSDGYLVLGGKDAQQYDILVKRYLSRGDIYVHADLQGAASVIIKNKASMLDSPIPPSTLSQAGTLVVTTSTAWESKAIMSAWWVNPDQVSKTTTTGDFLPSGSFEIRGKKNFLPPAQLLLGFGVMFQISDESKAKHLKHRHQDEILQTAAEASEIGARDDNFKVPEEYDDSEPDDTDNEVEPSRSVLAEATHDIEQGHSDSDQQPQNEEDGVDDATEYRNPLQSYSTPMIPKDKKYEKTSQGVGMDFKQHTAEEDDHSKTSSGEDSEDEQDSEQAQQSENTDPSGTNTPSVGVRHLSAQERRLLRKGQPVPASTAISDHDARSNTPSNTTSTNTAKPLAPHVRGKHGKRTKQKTKYAHQDAEDRELALRLLGSSTASTTKAPSTAPPATDPEAAKARRREQHVRAQEAGLAAEELRRINLAEGIETLDEYEAAELSLLDMFVGTPLAGDEILDALVVCGPWDALGGRLRWRVKIQPGAAKKGKAIREILGVWGKNISEWEKKRAGRKGGGAGGEAGVELENEEEKVRRREGELIRALRDVEVVGVVPVGKCRVVMGAGLGGEKGRGSAGKGKRGGRGSKKTR